MFVHPIFIHRNPREAGLVNDLARYRWSSYRAYAGLETAPAWLSTVYILKSIGRRGSHKRYIAYVAGDTDDALSTFYRGSKVSPILGDTAFKKKVLAGRAPDIDRPELRAARVYPHRNADYRCHVPAL